MRRGRYTMKKWRLKVVNSKAPCNYCKRFIENGDVTCRCLKYRIWWAMVEREVRR